jgi:glycosyltransferase involved in cell wall biosynthesis
LLEAHRQLAARLGLAGSVALPGFVADSFAFIRAADIFVLPSLEEGSGSVALLEALQAGVPILASRVDGIPEDVTHGVDAMLVEPANVEELARLLARLAADAPLRASLGLRARRTFETRFSAPALATALAGVYSALEEEASSSPA